MDEPAGVDGLGVDRGWRGYLTVFSFKVLYRLYGAGLGCVGKRHSLGRHLAIGPSEDRELGAVEYLQYFCHPFIVL